MEFKNYYSMLGVEQDASEDEVRRAYRRLARKYHPDVSKEQDAETRMRELNEAYEVLRDKEKRAAYDALAARVARGGGESFQPPPGWDEGFEFHHAPGSASEQADFSEFFSSLFGEAARRHAHRAHNASMRGEDHHAAIEIDLDDALAGATREITLRTIGKDAAGQPQWQTRTLSVRIPAGVREGQFIRLAGQGMPGHGDEKSGDLYLEVRFKPHRLYRVEGRDLYLDLPVAPWEAALGAQVRAPTPAGPVEVSIPAGSRAGRRLRLKGRGIPGETPGDLYLLVDIVLPPADSEAARAAYSQLAQALPFDPRRHLGV